MFGLRTIKKGTWETEVAYTILSSRVMVYVIANKEVGDYAAYIDAVPGKNHEKEFEQLLEERRGSKLDYEITKILFPYFDEKYIWRR